VFDFNVHLPCRQAGTQERLSDEATMTLGALADCYASHRGSLRAGMQGANFMLFNEDYPFGDHGLADWVAKTRSDWKRAAFTQLLDFRRPELGKALDRLAQAGVEGVKFHSYVQKIGDADIARAAAAARQAAQRGLFVCIDASYGTTRMYEYDNLRLAARVLQEVSATPVVILHSGGARCWEAMLLALDAPNAYLETSFTLPHYAGSSIEADLAFIYRKVGVERVLYASDFPYVGLNESRECAERFFDRYQFGASEREAILGNNARRLLDRLGKPAG
jgi:predicted TIM-barrel fold metal-dependent hydrolase